MILSLLFLANLCYDRDVFQMARDVLTVKYTHSRGHILLRALSRSSCSQATQHLTL